MPKKTFSKISEEKRDRVLTEAARFFAERGFSQSDMAELAARANVSKGSLYDYFESKEDLYISVCRDALRRSREAVYGGIKPGWDIYRQVDHIFRKGAAFSLAHPEYVQMYLQITSPGMEVFANAITREVEGYTAVHLKSLIRDGIQKGIVRKDIDINLTAFLINTVYIIFLASLVSQHFEIRMREYLEISGPIDQRAAETHLEKIVSFIEGFLRPDHVD
ncbi:MAG: TetR/AcrR family transcriptional regulator [Desulfomonile tiedjei]|nr:TetR/AcrR family transcriptional regulator [Desulfomonile tiedjei]